MKILLRILALVVALVVVITAGTLVFIFDTEGGLHWVTAQLVKQVPGKVTYEALHGRLADKISIQKLIYKLDNTECHIENLEIHLQPKDLLRGSLRIVSFNGKGIEYIQRSDSSSTQPAAPPPQVTNEIPEIPLTIKLDKGSLSGISILIEDEQTKDSQQPFLINEVTAKNISLKQKLDVHELRVKTPEYAFSIGGSVKITRDFPMDLHTSWQATLPEYATVIGTGNVSGDLQKIELSQSVEKPFKAQVHGIIGNPIDSALLTIKLSVAWQDFHWPSNQSPTITSSKGDIQLKGNADDYQFTVSASLGDIQQFPPGKWEINGHGGRDEVLFPKIEGAILDGKIHGEGKLSLQPQLAWQFKVNGRELKPGQQWPEWPGTIAFSGTIGGGQQDEKLYTTVKLDSLSGKIRDYPLAAQGKIEWTPDSIAISNLKINSENNVLLAGGTLTDRWNLDWELNASDINTLVPHLKGRFLGRGKVVGPKKTPHLTMAAQSKLIEYDEYTAASLDVSADIDLLATQPSIINLEATDINIGQKKLDAVELQLIGEIDDHNVHLTLNSGHTSADISLDGSLQNKQWSGEISGIDVMSKRFGTWGLASPVHYAVDPTTIQINEACWQNLPARLCTHVQWNKDIGGEVTLMATKLPLEVANELLPAGLKIDGSLDAQGKLNINANNGIQGSLQFNTSKGHLSNILASGVEIKVEYNDATVNVIFASDHISTDAYLNINDDNVFKASLSLPQTPLNIGTVPDFKDVPVKGQLNVKLKDLELLPYFIPDAENTKGTVDIDLTLGGTTSQPHLTGMAKLENGSAEIPRAGLYLTKIRISISGSEIGKLKVTSSAESGKGTLAIDGTLGWDRENKLMAQITIKGNRFEVVKIPEYWILSSPDLTINILHNRVDINGAVQIPEATIEPRDLESTQTPSSDVIIETGEQQEKQERWQIYSLVNIILGDQVKFDGFGLAGDIDGNVAIIDAPGQLTTAYGQVEVNKGVYQLRVNKGILKAYKQKLTVERGRLLFVGGSIDNPGLDINATRKIKEVTASVDIRGTLQNPQPPHVYCVPAMAETDCLSYLVLGFPMNQASQSEGEVLYGAATSIGLAGGELVAKQIGKAFQLDEIRIESGNTPQEASLVVGKYLSPRLYVSYGIGLIEPINTFILRYKLASKWSLETETGIDTGADLFYTLEK